MMATGRTVTERKTWFEHLFLRLASLGDGVWHLTLIIDGGIIKWSIKGGERLEQ